MRHQIINLAAIGSLVLLALIGSVGCAEPGLSAPIIKHTTFITQDGRIMLQPLVAERAVDGGFVVAGKAAAAAWAVKTDAGGNVVWRYFRDLAPEELGRHIPYQVEYRGVASMPDGSTFLCGSLVRQRGQPQPAMITHLSKNGDFLSEMPLQPKGVPGPLYFITKCTAWENGVIGIGSTYGPEGSHFWIFALDGNGTLRWEKSFEPLPPSARPIDSDHLKDEQYLFWRKQPLTPWGSSASLAQGSSGNAMLFIMRGNSNSEIMAVDNGGHILIRKALSGDAEFLRSSQATTQIEIFRSFNDSTSLHEIASIDDQLSLSTTNKYKLRALRFEGPTFARPDRTFVLVGTSNGSGQYVPPGIAHLDRNLEHDRHLPIEFPGVQKGMSGEVAVAGQNSGEYLLAVPVFHDRSQFGFHVAEGGPADGAALVLVDVP